MDWKKELEDYSKDEELRPCFCVGPQKGEKLCPCALRGEQRKEMEIIQNLRRKLFPGGDA